MELHPLARGPSRAAGPRRSSDYPALVKLSLREGRFFDRGPTRLDPVEALRYE